MSDDRFASETEPIHLWFELTYANYLVLPRSVLQSMPVEWQRKFCPLLDELHDAFGHLDWPSYNVRALVRAPELITVNEEACPNCGGETTVAVGDIDGGEEIDCPVCDGSGVDESDAASDHRYETPEEVGFRTDPIPHYNRGRTRLEPRT